jgi:hypothetical protein
MGVLVSYKGSKSHAIHDIHYTYIFIILTIGSELKWLQSEMIESFYISIV